MFQPVFAPFYITNRSSKALGHYDLSPCPTSKMTMNDREYFQSDPVLFTHGTLLNDEEDDMYAMRYNSTLRLPLSPPPSSTYSQTKLLPNIIEPLFVVSSLLAIFSSK
ncbi:unnamed protein product [Trichobilharzia regenti]|nr:unnamed protein product [Trichobilharzia regenti]